MDELNRIKVVLAENKRTCKFLAEQIGKDVATMSKWCTNNSQPSLETLVLITNTLNVNVRGLIVPTDNQKVIMYIKQV
jgi:transcriptional regulator with XRE-family HTH domain